MDAQPTFYARNGDFINDFELVVDSRSAELLHSVLEKAAIMLELPDDESLAVLEFHTYVEQEKARLAANA